MENQVQNSEIRSQSSDLIDNRNSQIVNSDNREPTIDNAVKQKKFLKIFPGSGKLGLLSKFIVFSAILLTGFGLLFITFFFTNLDTKIFKLKLIAAVVDENEQPIKDAEIFFEGDSLTQTGDNGIFEIGNLTPGKYDIKIVADGYSDYEEEVAVGRSFMNYTEKKVFVLKGEGEASLRGTFLQDNPKYNFSEDRIVIGENDYKINQDGSFQISNLESGKITFQFKSMSFKDISQEITLKDGSNRITDINLAVAGDITGELLSFIKQDPVENPDIQIENVSSDAIEIDNKSNAFAIRDLEVGREYSIRVLATNYVPRDYKVTIKQGENRIFGFKLVEQGHAIYKYLPEDASDFAFYVSEFDGENLNKIDLGEIEDFQNEYFNITENKLYFSAKAPRGITALINSSELRTPYSYDLSNGQIQSIITDTTDLGVFKTNFIAKKIVNITTEKANRDKRIIQVMDLNGQNRKTLQTLNDAEIEDAQISDNGKVVFAIIQNNENNDYGLFRLDVDSGEVKEISKKENIELLDVSFDGNRVLFIANNTSTSFKDLLMYDNERSEIRTLEVNVSGTNYKYLGDSDNTLLYLADKDGKVNIFLMQIEQGDSEQITNLGTSDEPLNVYQQGDLVYYITKKGLYVIDIYSPHDLKQVLEGEFEYTGN